MKTLIPPILVLSIIILVVFADLTKTFYQQDEWYGLGLTIADGANSIFNGVSRPIDFLLVKGRVASSFIYYLFASNFPLQNIQLSIFAIILHIIATSLVFLLIKRFIQNSLFALVGAIFFAVNAVAQGTITWPAIAINTVGSTIFILLSFFFFFKFLNDSRKKWLIIVGVVVYISLWFKETGLYLLLFLPLSAIIFKKYQLRSFIKTYCPFFLGFALMVSYRIIELNLRTTTSNLYITGLNENFFSTILMRSVLYPLTSFSLMFVPGDQFLEFARSVLRQAYPFFSHMDANILIAQSVILDLLSVILTFVIIGLVLLLLQKETKINRKFVYFWIIFSFMSFLPYVVLGKDFSYLESRYYYLSVVGGAVLLAWVSKRFFEIFGSKIFYFIFLPLIAAFLLFHANVVHGAIAEQVRLSNIRKDFITQLQILVPTLENKKNVFYVTSNQNYWADGNKIPFQQGSGFTFMIIYSKSMGIPKEFLREAFLFDIGSQGYKESGEYGFGYFWEKEELEKAIEMYNLPEGSIIGLEYNSETKVLNKI